MPIVDEKGRLFGRVNVIDLLAVLLAVAVVASSLVVVFGPDRTSSDVDTVERSTTRYATLTTDVPIYGEAVSLEPGDKLKVDDRKTVRISDVHRGFGPEDDATLVLQVAYERALTEPDYAFLGRDRVQLDSDTYSLRAHVLRANTSTADLTKDTLPVVIAINGSAPSTHAIEAGQEAQIGGHVVATITSVRRERGDGSRVFVGVELETWRQNGYYLFGSRVVKVGRPIRLVTDTTVIDGHVYAIDTETNG